MNPLFRRRAREGEPPLPPAAPLPPDASRARGSSSSSPRSSSPSGRSSESPTSPPFPSQSYPYGPAGSEPEPRPGLIGLFGLLFFKPGRFFKHFHALPGGAAPVALALSLGLAAVLSRGGASSFPGMASRDGDTWAAFWPPVLLLGLLWSMIIYFVGDWWFRKCIRWSGDRAADKATARKVFLWSGQVTALPVILYALAGTLIYARPSLWAFASLGFGIALLALGVWALVVDYIGVRSVFNVRRGRARFWFVAFPLLLIVVVMPALLGLSGAFSGLGVPGAPGASGFSEGIHTETPHVDDPDSPGAYRLPHPGFYETTRLANPKSTAAPDIVTPKSFSSRTMSFSYPGNWKILKEGVTFEPDSSVWVQSPSGSVQGILLYESALGEKAALEFAAESLTQMYNGSIELKAFDTWGTFAGRGMSFQGKEGDQPVTLRVFAASVPENRVLEVREVLFDKSLQGDRLGHELVRNSLKVSVK